MKLVCIRGKEEEEKKEGKGKVKSSKLCIIASWGFCEKG